MTKPHLASRCPRLFPAVIAAWLAVLAAPGQAANVSGTFVGVMDAGSIDVQGYFGAANTNYSGMTISGAYAYDTANLAPNSCLVIPGEACFLGTVSISVTIAGAGTLTFPGTPAS